MARISLQKGEGSDAFHRTVHCSFGGSVYRVEAFWKDSMVLGLGIVSSVDSSGYCDYRSHLCSYSGSY